MAAPEGFVLAVPWIPIDDADEAFEAWLHEAKLSCDALDPNDVRIDIGRTTHGDHKRYWVRRSLLTRE
jgi:hypothetical protein